VAIAETLSLHGHLFDLGHLDRLEELFTPDVVYDITDVGMGTLAGIGEIRRAGIDLGADNPLAHHVTNIVITRGLPRSRRRGCCAARSSPHTQRHNAHMYYVLLADHVPRAAFLDGLRARGVDAVFHYVPLHSSPAGRELGRASGTLSVTSHQSERLVRLPLWTGMEHELVDRVVATVTEVATALAGPRRRRRMTVRRLVPVVVGVFAIAGCGDDDSDSPTAASAPPAATAPAATAPATTTPAATTPAPAATTPKTTPTGPAAGKSEQEARGSRRRERRSDEELLGRWV
jgi:hypothetical protein